MPSKRHSQPSMQREKETVVRTLRAHIARAVTIQYYHVQLQKIILSAAGIAEE